MNAAEIHFHNQLTEDHCPTMAEEVLAGFTSKPKYCSPKYFYDQKGSVLFEKICELPEYYPTRTEEAILTRAMPEIAALAGENATLVEFGCGASRKVRLLLESMSVQRYLGIDISREFLLESTRRLAADYPWLEVHAACADFTRGLALPEAIDPQRLVGFFPGSSIGNFTPDAAEGFLDSLHRLLPPGSGLLIGVDLVKDHQTLEAAYNDADGITAEFNLNLLDRFQRELGIAFRRELFRHRAFFNAEKSRIEMHLESRIAQVLQLNGHTIRFREGESIHTENSYKYSVPGFQRLAARAGFASRKVWMDEHGLFSVHYLTASPGE
ncbi:L-histidine N(alpha)-methyltransferase [Marinobacter panjinensis]|uniref:L-histidine N(Alpha)-methyltransferase n=1 Tax=Marinobacter panjinensis TaxID=2576384 RepID=A0A4U6R2C5_9GAMM|nr:L-histidine N(alpha)-methyltransferase [Marinobacter panjinensis]MCR8915704.1 L-histidine N(alpha)-methyltransferase [Marinobacter panjinensis]TKV66942.1 L-histidine N(alpha)-methyltransferase [Marinobacter panjinensis]